MKHVLVDSSVWIEYFKGSPSAEPVSDLIDANLLCLNDLILAELVPYLKMQKQDEVIELLYRVENIPIDIDWDELIGFQMRNLKNGINRVGIPDLIIMQNALQNTLQLYSFDRHFDTMQPVFSLPLFKTSNSIKQPKRKPTKKKK